MVCNATRTDGQPCQAPVVEEGGFCFWHDPNRRQEMIEASRRGGSRRTVELPEVEPLTPERARTILAGVVEAVGTGALDAATARTAPEGATLLNRPAPAALFNRRLHRSPRTGAARG